MRNGMLRERVVIERATTQADSYGQPLPTWAELTTVWAEVRPTSSRERYTPGAGQVLAELTHRVRIRYREDVDELQRLTWRGRTLQVESVQDPTQRRVELLLLCREIRLEASEVVTPAVGPSLDFSAVENSMYLGGV